MALHLLPDADLRTEIARFEQEGPGIEIDYIFATSVYAKMVLQYRATAAEWPDRSRCWTIH